MDLVGWAERAGTKDDAADGTEVFVSAYRNFFAVVLASNPMNPSVVAKF